MHPDDALLASVSVHAIALRHIRVSSFPNGNRCKATPPLIWFHHLPKRSERSDLLSFCLGCMAEIGVVVVCIAMRDRIVKKGLRGKSGSRGGENVRKS